MKELHPDSESCNRRAYTDEDQDWDNPCVCYLAPDHEGLHECGEGCGAQWAGGVGA